MNLAQAKAFAETRYKELGKDFPAFNSEYKTNLIIKELRQKNNFDTLAYSEQHRGMVRVRSVTFPCPQTENTVQFNWY